MGNENCRQFRTEFYELEFHELNLCPFKDFWKYLQYVISVGITFLTIHTTSFIHTYYIRSIIICFSLILRVTTRVYLNSNGGRQFLGNIPGQAHVPEG